MKPLLTSIFLLSFQVLFAQENLPAPVEDRHPINYWWWIIGVLIVLGLGIAAYMLIKKDPRKDAV